MLKSHVHSITSLAFLLEDVGGLRTSAGSATNTTTIHTEYNICESHAEPTPAGGKDYG